MRTFIALEVSDQFRFEAAGLARQLENCVSGRFVQPANYHLTLAFLGEVDEREVALAIDALEAACDGRSAPLLTCEGLGKFGNAQDATLWLGIAATDELADVAAAIREELAARDLAFDRKPFKPHITLARRAAIPKASFPPLPFPEPDHACTAVLFKSKLDSEGARYTPLHSIELAPARNR